MVIDNNYERAASKVAAGIVNPVTGRRYVKSWRIDELIPFAVETYRAIEEKLNICFLHERNILRSLFNSGEENDWLARSTQEEYKKYILPEADISTLENNTNKVFSYGEVTGALQVEIHKLVKAYRAHFKENSCLLEEEFDVNNLKIEEEGVSYKDIQAEKIIFSEGLKAERNPYWSYLPFQGTKGEVIIARIPEVNFEKMYKYRIFIVPLPDKDTYWIGSMYHWTYDDDVPSEEGLTYLTARLRDAINVPFEIIEHKSAVRPTVKDRRPYLGLHPEFKQLAIFNGLGTKGASLAPFFAAQMADFLCKGKEVDAEVSIKRFED